MNGPSPIINHLTRPNGSAGWMPGLCRLCLHSAARAILLILILLFPFRGLSQNLFGNPGFEDLNLCTELRANCAPEAWFYIKPSSNPLVRQQEVPNPTDGTNLLLVPVENCFDPVKARSFVYTMLLCPLVKGEQYKLSILINTSRRPFYHLDLYFSEGEPATRQFDPFEFAPSIRITKEHITAKLTGGWNQAEFYYTATGNEQYCLLGNLQSAPMKFTPAERMNTKGDIYYFLDELSLLPVKPLPACDHYTINLKRLYGQNKRHTETAFVMPAPSTAVPVFITDSIIIPAAFFETNSAILKPGFLSAVDSLMLLLASRKIANIRILGHTDSRGTMEKNELLSKARAESVKEHLLKQMPQYIDLVQTYGMGATIPVASNDTEAGRASNRRVEIILTCISTGK